MVLYRKYRPQKLSELDLSEVRDKLVKTLTSSYSPHAFLFSGPKGTGKTSAARITAKILNCEKISRDKKAKEGNGGIEPCNECASCTAITEGRFLDVLEIDAASNRGIDEIRDLREKIKLSPAGGKFKVYIIDEVHMLTSDAFNALLKTLEEPPEHAVFILATTEPDKLPDTILSRSTKFTFKKASVDEVLSSLKRVVRGEKLEVSDEVLETIARSADGSFRDATKTLEQAVNLGSTDVSKINEMLGLQSVTPGKFLVMIRDGNVKHLLESIVKMGEANADFRLFTSAILNILHMMILDKFEISQKDLPDELKEAFDASDINSLIKLFSGVYSELKFASRPELPMETAVVEWCGGKGGVKNDKSV